MIEIFIILLILYGMYRRVFSKKYCANNTTERLVRKSVTASNIKSTRQVVELSTCKACIVKGHLAAQCPNNSNDALSKKSLVTNDRWERQKLIKRKVA
jgi:hypothetical protein